MIEITEGVGGDGPCWLILVDGFQWGPDPEQFDHKLGCSTQTWLTSHEACAVAQRAVLRRQISGERVQATR